MVRATLQNVFHPSSLQEVFDGTEFAPLAKKQQAQILTAFIRKAGISDPNITARSFRPTAATVANSGGISSDEILRLGRWSKASLEMVLRTYAQLGPGAHISDLLFKHFLPLSQPHIAAPSPHTQTLHDSASDQDDSDSDVVPIERPWHPFE